MHPLGQKSMNIEIEITRALKISPEVNFSFPWHFQPMDDENDDIRITSHTRFIIISLTKQAKRNSIFNAAYSVWAICNLIEKITELFIKTANFQTEDAPQFYKIWPMRSLSGKYIWKRESHLWKQLCTHSTQLWSLLICQPYTAQDWTFPNWWDDW